MGTTTETRITSTQAKDAIYKAHSINSSASEIDGVIKDNYTIVKPSILLAAGQTKDTGIILNINKCWRMQVAIDLKVTTKYYTLSGIFGYGGGDQITFGTSANGGGTYVRIGNVTSSLVRSAGIRLLDIDYNGLTKTVTIMHDGVVNKLNEPCTILQSTKSFMLGGAVRQDGTSDLYLSEVNLISFKFYDTLTSKAPSFLEHCKDIFRVPYLLMHKGGWVDRPENTMIAYKNAVNNGRKNLECDVQFTSDGVPVVIHDLTVDRTTNGTGNVKDKTLAQLQSLDAGSKFSLAYAGEKIPTFEEFCKFAMENNCTISPEIKDYRTVADIDIYYNMVVKYGLVSNCIFSSYRESDLIAIRALNSSAKVSYSATDVTTYVPSSLLSGAYLMVYLPALKASPSYVVTCRASGIKVIAWDVSNGDQLVDALNLNLDGILPATIFV